MDNRIKYIIAILFGGASMASGYYYPAETFLAFTAGWLFIIPAAFVAYMAYGYIAYMRDRKHRIEVTVKPTDAMKAIARREMDLKREKENVLFEESRRSGK
ncbi:MAG: hypothetical protein OIN83_02620 [Candidatus Methanoperedens sp.]|nr:hypothetical protein [Candidatus Methanoperedens sp.]